MITRLIAFFKAHIYTAAAVVAVILGAYGYGHRAASRAARQRQMQESERVVRKTIEVKNATEQRVGKLSGDTARDELRRDWMRK